MVRTTLVVGNETLGNPALLETVRECAAGGRVHVVVPATLLRREDRELAHSEGLVQGSSETIHVAVARWRLQRALQDLERAGIEADGHVGPPDAFEAVVEAVAQVAPDEIVISTLPSRTSRWLARDLPSRVRREIAVPVVVVEAAARA